VRRLPEKYRLPVLVCYLRGATLAEAAQELGWPVGTVSGRLARAREMLRTRLTRRGITVSAALTETVLARQAPAAVPVPLVLCTVRGALALVTGKGEAGGGLSAPVAALMKGVLNAMFLSKVKIVALIVLSLGAVAAGTWAVAYPALQAQQPNQKLELPLVAGPGPERAAAPPQDDEFPKLPTLEAARVEELLKAAKVSDKIRALLKERQDAALTEVRARWEELLAGRGTLDIFFGASLRLLESERELSDKKADQMGALESHWLRLKMLEEINQARFDAGRIPIADLSQTKFYRSQAELWLERAREK
jgi:hypothetical protein